MYDVVCCEIAWRRCLMYDAVWCMVYGIAVMVVWCMSIVWCGVMVL